MQEPLLLEGVMLSFHLSKVLDTKIDRNRIIDSLAERLEELPRVELARPMRIGFEGEVGIDEGLLRQISVLT